MKAIFGLLGILFTSQIYANSHSGYVEAIQMPAWVERSGIRMPLVVGMPLQSNDQISTGPNARVYFKMSEGSTVKLGENARINFARLEQKEDLFSAAMSVLKGAFRFTTDILAKKRRRDVSIQVATVTAGIRGTDFWGKAADDRDIVCLIEGHINVQRGNEPVIDMKDPLSFYVAPKDKPAKLGPVSAEQLAKWAMEVDIAPGQGAAHKGGKWKINLLNSTDLDKALSVYELARTQGYAAEIHPITKEETTIYFIRITNLSSKPEAQALADKLTQQMGIKKITVSR